MIFRIVYKGLTLAHLNPIQNSLLTSLTLIILLLLHYHLVLLKSDNVLDAVLKDIIPLALLELHIH